jgi:hypothetical protein
MCQVITRNFPRVLQINILNLFVNSRFCDVDSETPIIIKATVLHVGRDKSVGIVTRYRMAGGDEIFRTRPDWPWGPPSLLYNGYREFPRDKAAGVWR